MADKRRQAAPLGTCEGCGAPLLEVPGHNMPPGHRVVECSAGCWICEACGEHRPKEYACKAVGLYDEDGFIVGTPCKP